MCPRPVQAVDPVVTRTRLDARCEFEARFPRLGTDRVGCRGYQGHQNGQRRRPRTTRRGTPSRRCLHTARRSHWKHEGRGHRNALNLVHSEKWPKAVTGQSAPKRFAALSFAALLSAPPHVPKEHRLACGETTMVRLVFRFRASGGTPEPAEPPQASTLALWIWRSSRRGTRIHPSCFHRPRPSTHRPLTHPCSS